MTCRLVVPQMVYHILYSLVQLFDRMLITKTYQGESNEWDPKVAKTASFKEQVYQKLKTAIINQVLQPGEQLNERTLAENLGISRTPLREALHRLEAEGWIVTEAWKGTYVSDISQ